MARNSLSPGFLKMFYTTNGHPHIQTLPVNPLAPAGASTLLVDSGGANQLWTSAVADLVLLMKQYMHTTSSIDAAEIWTQATPSSVPLFQASMSVGVNGTESAAEIPFQQLKMSFRTKLGGKAVWMMLEGINAVNDKESAPLYGGQTRQQAVLSYLAGNSSVVWGRDNSYIASGIRSVTKINDGLRKKYLQP